MEVLSSHETTVFLLAIGSMLVLARFIAKIGEHLNIPTVLAEVLAGIILGPTILGMIFPDMFNYFFPATGHLPNAYETIFSLSVIMLLFYAGLELDFSTLSQNKKAVAIISSFGILIPFAVCVFFGWKYFAFFQGSQFTIAPFAFPMVFGTLLSLCALAVIARILICNNYMHSLEGTTIVGVALVCEVLGWFLFSSILVYINPVVENIAIIYTVLYIIGFFILSYILSGSKIFKNTILLSNKDQYGEPSYDLAMLLGICLLSGAFTNAIHIHPSLGAFMAGIIAKRLIGDNSELLEQLQMFIMNFFAPLFFISIGLKINFITNLNVPMMLAVLAIASITKIASVTFGAYLSGFKPKSAFIIGNVLNIRGAMEILMGAIAYKLGLIYSQLFVSIVLVALITCTVADYALRALLKKVPPSPELK